MTPDASISLVSLNRPDLVRQCLESVVAFTRSIIYDVHLVAHDFEPGELVRLEERWPKMSVHRVSGIRGYSQNNNVALRAALGRYVVVLNDDTIFGADVLGEIVRFLDLHPEVVGACPVLRNRDGTLQVGVRGRFTPLAFVVSQLMLDRIPFLGRVLRRVTFDFPWAPSADAGPVDIDAGTGACFVVRRAALEAIGFLDEAYFLGPDDIDWSMRLRRQGGRIVLLPNLSLVHLGGSTLGGRYGAVMPAVFAGCYTLFRRHYGWAAEWVARIVLGFGWSAVLSVGWLVVWLVSRAPRAKLMVRARLGCVRFSLSPRNSTAVFACLAAASH